MNKNTNIHPINLKKAYNHNNLNIRKNTNNKISTVFDRTKLINFHINNKNLCMAFQVFDEMKKTGIQPNEVTYNSLINGCIKANRTDMAFQVFNEMKANNIKLDVVTYNSLINGCIKANRTDMAFQVFNEMKYTGIQPSEVTYNSLINFKPYNRLKVFKKIVPDN